MTALDRLRRTLQPAADGDIPCWPQAYLYPVRFCDGDMRRYCTDPQAFSAAQLDAQRTFRYDGVGAGPDIVVEAESLGADVELPESAEPYLKGDPLVRSDQDVDRLRLPDPRTGGRLPFVLAAVQRLAEAVKGEVPIWCQVRSPFVLAANLMQLEPTLLAVREAADLLHRLIDFTTEFCRWWGRELVAAGADVIEIGNAIAGLLSPDDYRRFAAVPLRCVVDACHEVGALVALHMCGKTGHLMDQLIESGADIIEVDAPESLPGLCERFGRPVAWMGNIDPVEVLLRGPVSHVRDATERLLRQMGRVGRFILSTGCEPSIRTPPAHIQAMMEALREFNGACDSRSDRVPAAPPTRAES